MKNHDFLLIGAGIFGISAAIELVKRKHSVGIINPDTIPHHLAASTDISKAVRMEYGTDTEYFDMAEISIEKWLEWNDLFGIALYHEVGFLMLCKEKMESTRQAFERHSYQNLVNKGYAPERLEGEALSRRFPALNATMYGEASFNPKAGYVESGLAVQTLTNYARQLGVEVYEGQTAYNFEIKKGTLEGVHTKEGQQFSCGHAIVCAGTGTPGLLPELQPYMTSTGHPVFHILPSRPELFKPPFLSVFTADISNTGWYGFPFHNKRGVVKMAKHSKGVFIHPEKDDRLVSEKEIRELKAFLKKSFPVLANDPVVYTRRCLYTDTLDGHFWIDHHPEIKGLSVSSGGSGHGMKMGPVVGEMTADMAEGKRHRFSARYRWRHLSGDTLQIEEARCVENRKLKE